MKHTSESKKFANKYRLRDSERPMGAEKEKKMSRKMNKKRMGALFLVMLLVVSMLTACGKSNSSSDGQTASEENKNDNVNEENDDNKSSNKNIKIGISLPTNQEERFSREQAAAEEYAKELGVEVVVQMANGDPATQYTQVENLCSQGIDVLLVCSLDASALAPAIQRAHEDGILTVGYDRDIQNCYLDAYVMNDIKMIGKLMSEYVADHLDKGNIAFINGDQKTSKMIKDVHDGMYTALQDGIDKGDYKVILDQYVTDWKPETALALTENALSMTDNNMQAILVGNDGMASGVIQALEAQGLDGKVLVTGLDGETTAIQRIAKGTQSMTVFMDVKKMMRTAIDTCVQLFNSEAIDATEELNNGYMDVPVVRCDLITVDKSNLDEIIIDGGYMTHEEVYGS